MSRTEGQQLSGTVKRYSLAHGYGFITCDDGGADCFVHQSSIVTDGFRALMKGHKVTFSYTVNKGKDTATAVQPDPPVYYATRLEAKKESSKVNRDPDVLDGTIKWFNVKKGFGFIIPQEGEEELFVHVREVEGQIALREADEVQYKVAMDEKQMRCATGVRLTTRNGQYIEDAKTLMPQMGFAQPPAQLFAQPSAQMFAQPSAQMFAQPPAQMFAQPPAQQIPGQQSGTVKWFNELKGFGFITTPMGTDIYTNRPHLSKVGGSLTQGETVTFETQSSNGKTWATNVCRPSQAQGQAPVQQYAQQPQYVYVQQAPAAQPELQYAPATQYVVVGAKRKLDEAPVASYANTARPKPGNPPQQVQYVEYTGQQPTPVQQGQPPVQQVQYY